MNSRSSTTVTEKDVVCTLKHYIKCDWNEYIESYKPDIFLYKIEVEKSKRGILLLFCFSNLIGCWTFKHIILNFKKSLLEEHIELADLKHNLEHNPSKVHIDYLIPFHDLFAEEHYSREDFNHLLSMNKIPEFSWIRAHRDFFTHDGLSYRNGRVIHIYLTEEEEIRAKLENNSSNFIKNGINQKCHEKINSYAMKDPILRCLRECKIVTVRRMLIPIRKRNDIRGIVNTHCKDMYGKGSYNLESSNCQHYVSDVLGAPHSPDAEVLGPLKELLVNAGQKLIEKSLEYVVTKIASLFS